MKTLRGTYVRRGDTERRRIRTKRVFLALSFFGALAFLVGNREPAARDAEAAPVGAGRPFRIDLSTDRSLGSQLDSARGELALARVQLDRANKVISFSTQYAISANLAANIVDVARAEGIDPDLAFRLVKHESDFNVRAKSPVGAVGLTQVMLGTAREYDKRMTVQRLYHPTTNLRIGLRYLRDLVNENKGDMNLALLVYNRGPAAVARAKSAGDNPSNGYDRILTRNYKGPGVIQ